MTHTYAKRLRSQVIWFKRQSENKRPTDMTDRITFPANADGRPRNYCRDSRKLRKLRAFRVCVAWRGDSSVYTNVVRVLTCQHGTHARVSHCGRQVSTVAADDPSARSSNADDASTCRNRRLLLRLGNSCDGRSAVEKIAENWPNS